MSKEDALALLTRFAEEPGLVPQKTSISPAAIQNIAGGLGFDVTADDLRAALSELAVAMSGRATAANIYVPALEAMNKVLMAGGSKEAAKASFDQIMSELPPGPDRDAWVEQRQLEIVKELTDKIEA